MTHTPSPALPPPASERVTFKNGPVMAQLSYADFLRWIADRMEHVHGENPNYDYMHRIRELAASIVAAPPQVEPADGGRDIYEVANQLEGWVGPDTPERLAQFLLREGREASALADQILSLRHKVEETGIEPYFERQIVWSRETFGPALRTGGVIDHIRKELTEIEADPHDLSEWIDVVILAMDGFWRHGGAASDLMPRLLAKQQKNMARSWPDWRTMSENQAIEHNRSEDRALAGEQP